MLSSRSRVKAGIARLRHQALAGKQAAVDAPLANGVHDCRPESREARDGKGGVRVMELRAALDAALPADACKWLTVQATRPNPHRPGLAKPTRIGINQSPVPGQGTSEALHRLIKALHVRIHVCIHVPQIRSVGFVFIDQQRVTSYFLSQIDHHPVCCCVYTCTRGWCDSDPTTGYLPRGLQFIKVGGWHERILHRRVQFMAYKPSSIYVFILF
ncbi:hypothetical protein V8C34DRAFT_197773 [Trichoderma compactum]